MSIDVTPPSTNLSDRVAEEIRAAMARRRVPGAELARRLGVSAMWVSYRLGGRQEIGLTDLERIAGALGMSPAELLPSDVRGMVRPTPAKVTPAERPRDNRPKGRAPGGLTRAQGVRRPTWKRGLTPDAPLLAAG